MCNAHCAWCLVVGHPYPILQMDTMMMVMGGTLPSAPILLGFVLGTPPDGHHFDAGGHTVPLQTGLVPEIYYV